MTKVPLPSWSDTTPRRRLLDFVARVTRPGGALVLTVKDTVWAEGFSQRVRELEAAGILTLLEETPAYVSMPGRPETLPARGVALRVA